MGIVLLLTGEPGIGKSTALQKVLAEVGPAVFAGFVADERRRDGERCGFDIAMLDGRRGTLASIESDSPIRVGGANAAGMPRYGVELEFLESVAMPELLKVIDGESPRIVVVDEIGPMQLYSDVFRSAIADLVESDVIVVGTIVLRSVPWTDQLKARDNVETFLLTKQNRNSMASMMALYVRSLIHVREGAEADGTSTICTD